MNAPYASAGSQRWLQVAVDCAPDLLLHALRGVGALGSDETVAWKSPLKSDNFTEYRDNAAFRLLNAEMLPKKALSEFWPSRGPVWDALGVTSAETRILLEAKAHIPEAASPPSRASEKSLDLIRRSLEEARRFYAPKATADWSGSLYQYANRLAIHYFLRELNGFPAILIFLDFLNAREMKGPTNSLEWKGATRLIHALLGLPASLEKYGVFHAYVDVRALEDRLLEAH
ncbi:hypothetical protein [Desulfobulbus propionicus]